MVILARLSWLGLLLDLRTAGVPAEGFETHYFAAPQPTAPDDEKSMYYYHALPELDDSSFHTYYSGDDDASNYTPKFLDLLKNIRRVVPRRPVPRRPLYPRGVEDGRMMTDDMGSKQGD